MKKKIIVCLLFLSSLLFVPQAWASKFPEVTNGQINEALQKTVPVRFLPSNPLYILIVAKENVLRFFKPSLLKKTEFDSILSGKRLKEAYLLLEENNADQAGKTLQDYSKKMTTISKELDKAKSQNQDVTPLTSEIAEELKQHEVLFSAISKKRSTMTGKVKSLDSFDKNFNQAFESFIQVVLKIDTIQPGLKNRFKATSS